VRCSESVSLSAAADPVLLLCDEPLLNLICQRRLVSALINQRRREADTACWFVTHEVIPFCHCGSGALFGRRPFRIGTVEE